MKRTYGVPFHASPTELGWLSSVFKSGESLWDGSTFGTVPIVYQKIPFFRTNLKALPGMRIRSLATETRASASGLAQRSRRTPQVDGGQIHRRFLLTNGDLLSAAE